MEEEILDSIVDIPEEELLESAKPEEMDIAEDDLAEITEKLSKVEAEESEL